MRYVELTAFSVLLAMGQFLFKKAALAGAAQPLPWAFINGWMFAALTLYGCATLLWVWVLRTTPLSVAYPFAALAFVIVPLGAAGFLGESVNVRQLLGIALIVSGILVSNL